MSRVLPDIGLRACLLLVPFFLQHVPIFFYIASWQNHLFYRLDRNSDCENNMVKLIRLTAIFRNKHNEQLKLNKLAKRHARSSLHAWRCCMELTHGLRS